MNFRSKIERNLEPLVSELRANSVRFRRLLCSIGINSGLMPQDLTGAASRTGLCE
jgi:hypothetical protein